MQKIFLLLVSLLFSITISAANLKGSVTDFSGKSSFEGAIVTVDGTNFRTSTDREGIFSITGMNQEGITLSLPIWEHLLFPKI